MLDLKRIRRRIAKPFARSLRRWANRLDPPVQTEPITPLELIETTVLADEIRRRNDCCILAWARNSSTPGHLHTWRAWSVNPWQANVLLNMVICGVTQQLGGMPPSRKRRRDDNDHRTDGRDR